MATAASAGTGPGPMTPEEKKVIFASSLGTVFEWYDFYLYGTLAAIKDPLGAPICLGHPPTGS